MLPYTRCAAFGRLGSCKLFAANAQAAWYINCYGDDEYTRAAELLNVLTVAPSRGSTFDITQRMAS